jgi:hypothetical protein
MVVVRNLNPVALALSAVMLIAGCGPMPESTPTAPTVPATPPVAPDDATPGTPETASQTFGDLADRVAAAWPQVVSYRVTFTGTAPSSPVQAATPVSRSAATPAATPTRRPPGTYTTVREVELPDRQRQSVTGLGADDHEAIAIGNALYVRGPLVEQIAPTAAPEEWIELDPTSLPEGAQLLLLLGGLPEIPGAPLATLPERLRAQDVRELDALQHDGRECRVFAAADTVPATGMRVDYTIAIDHDDIPCFIETGTGGVTQGRDEYTDIGAEFGIEPPASATPVSIPPTMATPIAHD